MSIWYVKRISPPLKLNTGGLRPHESILPSLINFVQNEGVFSTISAKFDFQIMESCSEIKPEKLVIIASIMQTV